MKNDFGDFDSIVQLKNLKGLAREEYHETIRAIDARIDEIRKERGTVLKGPSTEPYFEQGRDKPKRNGN